MNGSPQLKVSKTNKLCLPLTFSKQKVQDMKNEGIIMVSNTYNIF